MERVWKTILQNNPDHLFIAAAGNDNVEINDNYRPLTCGIQEPNLLCVALIWPGLGLTLGHTLPQT